MLKRTLRTDRHRFSAQAVPYALALIFAFSLIPMGRAAEPIKIGVIQTSGAGPMYLALERGYFAAEGFEAQIIPFDNAQSIAVAIATQGLDFGATSMTAGFYNLAAQNLVRIIAAQGRDAPGFPNSGVVVSNEAWEKGLRSFADLKGHSIGVTTLGSAPHYCVGLIADKYGIPLSSLNVETLKSNPNIMAALASNRLDAAIMTSTFALPVVRNGQGHLLGWIGDETPWQLGAAYTSTKIADEQGSKVKRFLRAYIRGMHDYYDAFISPGGTRRDAPEAEAVLAIMSKSLSQPADLLRTGITYVDREARLDARDIRHQIEWYQAQKLYTGEVDADQLIDKRYAVTLPVKAGL